MPRWTWLTLLAAVVLALVAHSERLLPGDTTVLRLLERLPPQPVRAVAVASSAVALAALTVVLAWALRRTLRPPQFLVLAAGVPIMERVTKLLVHRPRPAGGSDGWSFPSGHALFTMTLAVLIVEALWSRAGRRWRTALALLAALGVALVGLDRVALGVHWPSDVLGGWMIGLVYGAWTGRWAVREAAEEGEGDDRRGVPAAIQG